VADRQPARQKPRTRREPGEAQLNRNSPQAANRRINRKTEGVQTAILDAAAEIFARKGYQRTKLSDISDELDMHVTALRYHFPTKEMLAEEIVNRVARTNLERLQEALAALGPNASVRDKLSAAITAYMRVTATSIVYIAAHGNIVNQLPDEARAAHYRLLRDFLGIWRSLVGEAAERGELAPGLNPSVATQVILGAVIWSREWYQPERTPPDEIAEQIKATLFGGLLAPR
jgi:AcrR family transcriptional regulator